MQKRGGRDGERLRNSSWRERENEGEGEIERGIVGDRMEGGKEGGTEEK